MSILVTQLRKLKPAKVLVFDDEADAEPKTVKIGAGRKRWDSAGQTLASMDWVRLECVDAEGNTLGVIRNGDRAAGAPAGRPSPDELERYLEVILKGQKAATDALNAQTQPVMTALVEREKQIAARADALERSIMGMLKLVARTTVQSAQTEADAIVLEAEAQAQAASGGTQADQLAAMVLKRMLGMADDDDDAPEPKAKPNGKRKASDEA